MSAEFTDTNILVYAHDATGGAKQAMAAALLARLADEGCGALSTQVLAEFYSVATRKLGIGSVDAETIIGDLGSWTIHRPAHRGILDAIRLQHRHKLSWWGSLILASALDLGCSVLWSEDYSDGRKIESITVRNPFLELIQGQAPFGGH